MSLQPRAAALIRQHRKDAEAERRTSPDKLPCGCYREPDTGAWSAALCTKGHDQ